MRYNGRIIFCAIVYNFINRSQPDISAITWSARKRDITMKKIDCNSVVNQEIKGRFVAREVKTCFSYEMEAILRASSCGGTGAVDLPDYKDIENFYTNHCPECGEDQSSNLDICPDCEKAGRIVELENTPQEVFEWWIITEYLYKKLQAKGEPVLEWGNNYYWGRTCTGQAILLDGVISDICAEMEILAGQKYDWSKNK